MLLNDLLGYLGIVCGLIAMVMFYSSCHNI